MINKSNLMAFLIFIMTITMSFSQIITDGCELPSSSTSVVLHVNSNGDVLFKSQFDMGGYEFILDGVGPTAEVEWSGGVTEAESFLVSHAYNVPQEGYKVISFTITVGAFIPAGCGT